MIDQQSLFVGRLSEHDLEVLTGLGDTPGDARQLRQRLSRSPDDVETYLADPGLFDAVFPRDEPAMNAGLTPLLVFAALVYRARRDLGSAAYLPEWVGAGERLPVFDVATIREFIDVNAHSYVIIELLNSFTRVASGSVWVKTRRGYRRRRYSELDPLRLAEMVESLPAPQRAGGYRRLGEVALFLTGVFPDHTARHPLSATGRAQLARVTGVNGDGGEGTEYLHFLERLGSVWYERAAATPLLPSTAETSLREMAAGFTPARRFLNYLADSYLHRLDTGLMNPLA